ncbi:MAG: hypothetical protein EOM21_08735, partial [Gammaproteobacteria bacterium]|nr:hypothetical protein [Gammaproteobacteria bacterium]
MKIKQVYRTGLLLLCSIPWVGVCAQPTLVMGSASGTPGQVVTTDVGFANLADAPGPVVGMQFSIQYDPARLVYNEVTADSALSPHAVRTNGSTPGTLLILLTPPIENPLPALPDGALLNVEWSILAGASPGVTELALAEVILGNREATAVIGETTAGGITITMPTPVPT